MECRSRGLECVFEPPKKRGRKKQSKNSRDDDEESEYMDVDQQPQQLREDSPSPTSASVHSPAPSVASSTGSTSSGTPSLPSHGVFTAAKNKYHPYAAPAAAAAAAAQLDAQTAAVAGAATAALASYNKKLASKESIRQLLDVYFQFVGCGMPLIDRQDVEEHLKNAGKITKDSPVHLRSAQALLNAIQATALQRLGHKQEAREMFEKTRELCLQVDVYEQHVSNFHVASAMLTMAIYLIGERKDSLAKMYLNNAYFFLEQQQSPVKWMALTVEQQDSVIRMRRMVAAAELMLALNSYSYEEVEKKALGHTQEDESEEGRLRIDTTQIMMSNLQKKLEICKRILSTSHSQDEELNTWINQLIASDRCQKDKPYMCILLLKQTLDTLERMDEKLQATLDGMPVAALCWSITLQGFKLEVLSDYQYYNLTRDPSYNEKLESVNNLKRLVADKISRMILVHSSYFPLVSVTALKYVLMAALIHMKHATKQQGKAFYTDDEILAFLKADLWALECAERRYAFPNSEQVISTLKNIIAVIENRKMLLERQSKENELFQRLMQADAREAAASSPQAAQQLSPTSQANQAYAHLQTGDQACPLSAANMFGGAAAGATAAANTSPMPSVLSPLSTCSEASSCPEAVLLQGGSNSASPYVSTGATSAAAVQQQPSAMFSFDHILPPSPSPFASHQQQQMTVGTAATATAVTPQLQQQSQRLQEVATQVEQTEFDLERILNDNSIDQFLDQLGHKDDNMQDLQSQLVDQGLLLNFLGQ